MLTLLKLEEWKERSTPVIAKHCGVSQKTVYNVKEELSNLLGSETFPEKTLGADGKRRPAKKKLHKEKSTESEPGPEHMPVEEESEPETPSAPSVYTLKDDQPYTNGKDLKPYYTIPQWDELTQDEQVQLLHNKRPSASIHSRSRGMPSSLIWIEQVGQELQRTAKDLCQSAHELIVRTQAARKAAREVVEQSTTLREQRQQVRNSFQEKSPF